MEQVLKVILAKMQEAKVNYHFEKYKTSKPSYPYYIGELFPVIVDSEDGMKQFTMVLDGFHRGTLLELLKETEKIEKAFPMVEGFQTLVGNQSIIVFFSSCQPIPSGEEQLEKVEIQLLIKTWKG